MIKPIKAGERFFFQTDWLQTYWHFSFDHYYDPNNMNWGNIRVFNDDVIKPKNGFDFHQHRDMEIVTFIISGELTHRDNLGNEGIIKAGDVQRMTAGKGIIHSEKNEHSTNAVHLLQMWVLPDRAGLEPSYEEKHFDYSERLNKLLPVVSNEKHPASLHINQDVTFYVSDLEASIEIAHLTEKERYLYLYTIDGELQANDVHLSKADSLKIHGEEIINFKTKSKAEFLLIDCNG
jgi:redox-sensitive bicupin YhaK (pirin superfamily)